MKMLGKLMTQVRGLSYSRNDVIKTTAPNYVPVLRAGNIQGGRIIKENYVYVPERLVKERQFLKRGDILIAASSGSISIVGKAAMVENDMEATFGAFCKVLRPESHLIEQNYLKHFFETLYYKRTIKSLAEGANINNLKTEHFDNLKIPLPPLAEQKRIANILDQADQLRQLNQQILAEYDTLTKSLFLDMFGDPVVNPMGWSVKRLDEIAKISSGITKGRKTRKEEFIGELPYMRVANVQDGFLALSEIKTIPAYKSDLDRFRLKLGDVLMTEGGDPDKLGRGAVWNNEIETCLHQNHIFKVRVDRTVITPLYFSMLAGSQYGKRYFLKVAKQTTGIATINKTQLSSFPVLITPLSLQNKFVKKIKNIEAQKASAKTALAASEDLFNSLLQKAFKGEL